MAGDWIAWTVGLTRKREVLALSRALAVSPREAACLCMEIWEWADRECDMDPETRDGNARGVTCASLDVVVGVPGFGAAFRDVAEWVIETPDGIVFPGVGQWTGKSSRERLLTAIRVGALRSKRNAKRNAGSNGDTVNKTVTRVRGRVREEESSLREDSSPSPAGAGEPPAPTRRGRTKSPETEAPESLTTDQIAKLAAWTRENFPDLEPEVPTLAATCLEHWRGKGERRVDWVATVRTWIGKEAGFRAQRGPSPGKKPARQTASDVIAKLRAARSTPTAPAAEAGR